MGGAQFYQCLSPSSLAFSPSCWLLALPADAAAATALFRVYRQYHAEYRKVGGSNTFQDRIPDVPVRATWIFLKKNSARSVSLFLKKKKREWRREGERNMKYQSRRDQESWYKKRSNLSFTGKGRWLRRRIIPDGFGSCGRSMTRFIYYWNVSIERNIIRFYLSGWWRQDLTLWNVSYEIGWSADILQFVSAWWRNGCRDRYFRQAGMLQSDKSFRQRCQLTEHCVANKVLR